MSNPSAEVVTEEELISNPHYERFKMQGKNRFLARVHKNVEYKTNGGIYVPNTRECQDIETTGEVLKLSANFDHDLYPDVKVGANIKVVLNSWYDFPYKEEKLAMGDAESIIAVY